MVGSLILALLVYTLMQMTYLFLLSHNELENCDYNSKCFIPTLITKFIYNVSLKLMELFYGTRSLEHIMLWFVFHFIYFLHGLPANQRRK